jgi:hypothetical protein
VQFAVSGVQVHDARLAASMYTHGIMHILTFNESDFIRFVGNYHPTSSRSLKVSSRHRKPCSRVEIIVRHLAVQ